MSALGGVGWDKKNYQRSRMFKVNMGTCPDIKITQSKTVVINTHNKIERFIDQ